MYVLQLYPSISISSSSSALEWMMHEFGSCDTNYRMISIILLYFLLSIDKLDKYDTRAANVHSNDCARHCYSIPVRSKRLNKFLCHVQFVWHRIGFQNGLDRPRFQCSIKKSTWICQTFILFLLILIKTQARITAKWHLNKHYFLQSFNTLISRLYYSLICFHKKFHMHE